MKNGNRVASTSFFTAACCFFIVALINFFGVKTNISEGVIFMGLGAAFLCLGSIYLNKEKRKTNEETEKKESNS